MTLLDWLRKLGILRFGVKTAVWHGGKDMPAEMLMDGVFKAEKDLVGKTDPAARDRKSETETGAAPSAQFCIGCDAPLPQGTKFCAVCGRKV